MTLTVIEPQAGTRHAEVIAGLANAQAFLAAHPALPLGISNPLHYHSFAAGDEDARAEVDRIAAMLGVQAGYTDLERRHYYQDVRDFGGGIAYRATANSRESMDRWHALVSYDGNVQPETGAAA